jgi:hypothetical protein
MYCILGYRGDERERWAERYREEKRGRGGVERER